MASDLKILLQHEGEVLVVRVLVAELGQERVQRITRLYRAAVPLSILPRD
jgi:hypothetical protein